MNKVNVAAFLMALLVVGAIAAPRKVLETTEASEAAASSEQHQRILAELEEIAIKMNKFNVAVFFAAMLIVGACAAPRKMLISSGTQEMADAAEHQRILQELETIQALRDRMLAEAATYQVVSTTVGAPAPAPM
ncbi:TPA: hypothetical protein ACH3X2_007739 [Trebouxia sp. C0005]